MKKKLICLALFLGCFFAFPFGIHAECSYERQAELSRIAANVKFSYAYELVNAEPRFDVMISNITDDIYVEDGYENTFINDVTMQYTHGQAIYFYVRSRDNACRGELLIQQHINLPSYNLFSARDECRQNPNFSYCQLWADTSSITEKEFQSKLKKYINHQIEVQKAQTQTFWDKFLYFIEDSKTMLIICGVVTILLILLLVYRWRRF